MIALLALVALLAFAAGGLAGWIAASEYHWRFERRTPLTTRLYARRDEPL